MKCTPNGSCAERIWIGGESKEALANLFLLTTDVDFPLQGLCTRPEPLEESL